MKITGMVAKRDGKWMIDGWDGVTYELSGGDIKPRMEGLTVQVVGTIEDAFGLGLFVTTPTVLVQKIRVT